MEKIVGKYYKERKDIATTNYYHIIDYSVWPDGMGRYYILTLEETIRLDYGFTVCVNKKYYRDELIDMLISNIRLASFANKTLTGEEKAGSPIKEISKEEFDKAFSDSIERAKNWEVYD